MKLLSKKIEWYCNNEERKWKRIYHSLEIGVISISAWSLIFVVLVYGNGENLQYPILFFIAGIAISSGALIPVIHNSVSLNRWQTQAITIGLGCAVGLSTICSLLLLELQLANT